MARRPLATTLRIPATLLAAGYWLCMFIGTHMPQPERLISPDVWDKALHAAAYAGLTALVLFNLLLRGPLRWSRMVTVVALVTLVGLFDELTQIPVGRDFEWLDLAADLTGAVAATAVVALVVTAIDRLPRRRLREA